MLQTITITVLIKVTLMLLSFGFAFTLLLLYREISNVKEAIAIIIAANPDIAIKVNKLLKPIKKEDEI